MQKNPLEKADFCGKRGYFYERDIISGFPSEKVSFLSIPSLLKVKYSLPSPSFMIFQIEV